METAVLLLHCNDQKGIVTTISQFLFEHHANIIDLEQHSTATEGGYFFLRIAFYFDEKEKNALQLQEEFFLVANQFDAKWKMFTAHQKLRLGILVSKTDHCLYELLYEWQAGELDVEIPFILSNHLDLKRVADQYRIPFHHFPISKENKYEKEILSLVKEETDFLVLARYMQILSQNFLGAYGKDVINIHHSFLPSFIGANPYKQAYNRGVKIIGATAHYVTDQLDQGPIIRQLVAPVSHKDDITDLKRKGRNLEKLALSQAIHDHVDHRIIKYGNKTVVFGE